MVIILRRKVERMETKPCIRFDSSSQIKRTGKKIRNGKITREEKKLGGNTGTIYI